LQLLSSSFDTHAVRSLSASGRFTSLHERQVCISHDTKDRGLTAQITIEVHLIELQVLIAKYQALSVSSYVRTLLEKQN
jgi:hypothetical protein